MWFVHTLLEKNKFKIDTHSCELFHVPLCYHRRTLNICACLIDVFLINSLNSFRNDIPKMGKIFSDHLAYFACVVCVDLSIGGYHSLKIDKGKSGSCAECVKEKTQTMKIHIHFIHRRKKICDNILICCISNVTIWAATKTTSQSQSHEMISVEGKNYRFIVDEIRVILIDTKQSSSSDGGNKCHQGNDEHANRSCRQRIELILSSFLKFYSFFSAVSLYPSSHADWNLIESQLKAFVQLYKHKKKFLTKFFI